MALRSDNPTAVTRPSRRRLANAIRMLSMDAVEAAKSGHPGMPMGMADIAEVLWNDYLKFNPANGHWHDRDRFVLSNGHASMLLWSVLHLTATQAVDADYERLGHASVSLDDIRHFRQLDSRAPGHPEYHWVSGVETTTGPLGQGVATSVGMAIAQKWLANRYNRPGFEGHRFFLYVAMGAPIFHMNDTGNKGVLVTASGQSGRGKTTCLKACSSIWGHPEALMLNGNKDGSTVNALYSALGTVQVLSGLDEGEQVVTAGVFTLKSLLLKSTIAEHE